MICDSCGRRHKRDYCEFCQREARWWAKYRQRAMATYLPPRLQRELDRRRIDVGDTACSLRDGGGLLLCGRVGTGKTSFAAACALDTLRLRMVEGVGPASFQFASTADLVGALKASFDSGAEESAEVVTRRYTRSQLLVLDDIDDISPTEWAVGVLDYIVNYRYEHLLSMIVTTNARSLGELGEWIGQERIPSRLGEMCRVIDFGETDQRPALAKATS